MEGPQFIPSQPPELINIYHRINLLRIYFIRADTDALRGGWFRTE
jgi:hypothetical protein